MQNFENSLVNEFKEKKNNFCDAKQFLESINDFDKILKIFLESKGMFVPYFFFDLF